MLEKITRLTDCDQVREATTTSIRIEHREEAEMRVITNILFPVDFLPSRPHAGSDLRYGI